MLRDKFGRSIRDLRISVTDRCNFRCTYCMPKEEYQNFDFLPKNQILTYEEISVVVRTLIPMGLKKIRITGGEPLLRKDLAKLIKMIREQDDSIDIAITTNGVLLSKYAQELSQAGLSRVTVRPRRATSSKHLTSLRPTADSRRPSAGKTETRNLKQALDQPFTAELIPVRQEPPVRTLRSGLYLNCTPIA